ncbi:hypothetical protein JOL62DRAFT_582338 [Phyllosticta paracitricarpa]|uniref:Uncharacterized protein n=1 Tax=Phyllosticta paracitricarpa TaxID=2016321 RepID=A0ABR1N179_9PEZI
MGLFSRKNKGSGAQKPLVISAPTGFKHVEGHSNMALTARPIVGGKTDDAALAAPVAGASLLAPKPDSRAAEVSTMDLTALPAVPPPPARKGLGKKILSVFRGRKAKGQTGAAAAAADTTTTAAAAASSSSESAPARRPATPVCVSPVRPSARVAPRIPALDFVAPASSRAETLAALSSSRSCKWRSPLAFRLRLTETQPWSPPASWRRWRGRRCGGRPRSWVFVTVSWSPHLTCFV